MPLSPRAHFDAHMERLGYDLFLIVPANPLPGWAHRFYLKDHKFLVFSMMGNNEWPYGMFDLYVTEKTDFRDWFEHGKKINNQRTLNRWMRQFEFSDGFKALLPSIRRAL